ncbi:hypothetical protein FJTKL_08509 [Diaporthe vaccinii]|uniref:Magnesium transporter n=1 Tax=Diaporthe vaccinii TaxID=105482 RepID=A0ABR4ERA3_9PEZI
MNKKPLRRTGDLQFLKLAPFRTDASGSDDCIYEAQISVLLTGVDHWSSTAFAFIDTYYKGAENNESVEHYIDQVQYGPRLDPLTEGQYDAEPPVWRPREYFLRLLESRVKQVKREWHNTVFRILQRIEPHTHDDLLSEPENRQGLAGDVLNKDTQIFFDKTIRLLQQMSYQLSLTVDAWMRFMNVELAYFTNLENLPGKKRTPVMLISEINKEMEDLLVLRKNLDHQRDLLHGLSQKLEKGLQLDNNAIEALQQKNAVLITALTISASFLGLISTTASIFSIEDGPAPDSVAGVVVALLSGLLLIFAFVLRWPWFAKLFELLERSAPYWISLGRWARNNLRQLNKTMPATRVPPPGVRMGQLQNSNSTAV